MLNTIFLQGASKKREPLKSIKTILSKKIYCVSVNNEIFGFVYDEETARALIYQLADGIEKMLHNEQSHSPKASLRETTPFGSLGGTTPFGDYALFKSVLKKDKHYYQSKNIKKQSVNIYCNRTGLYTSIGNTFKCLYKIKYYEILKLCKNKSNDKQNPFLEEICSTEAEFLQEKYIPYDDEDTLEKSGLKETLEKSNHLEKSNSPLESVVFIEDTLEESVFSEGDTIEESVFSDENDIFGESVLSGEASPSGIFSEESFPLFTIAQCNPSSKFLRYM